MILPGVTYSTQILPNAATYFFNIDYGGNFTGGFLDAIGAAQVLTITFDGPQSAFGFETNFLMPSFDITINTAGGSFSQTLVTPGAGITDFFGFASTSNITSATIQSLIRTNFLGSRSTTSPSMATRSPRSPNPQRGR